MGFLQRLNAASAALFGPSDAVSNPDGWTVRLFGGGRTKAGPAVSEHNALQFPAVYACVNRISNPVARFPAKIFRNKKGGGTEEATDHPFSQRLAIRPNDFMSSRTLRKTIQAHALLWGNGYAEIERNGRGQAVQLWPLLPDRTSPVRDGGHLVYRTNIAGETHRIDYRDVIHIMDQSFDGYVGISPIAMARQAIGMGLAMEEFGAKFFANDAKSGGFLLHPGKLSAGARANLGGKKDEAGNPAASLEKQGGLENAHRVKVLEEGMKFVQTMIPPEDAQFLGSREMQITEIARLYDVPLILLQLQDKQTSFGAGIEQLMIGFVRQTVEPWVHAWEQELNWKLFTDEELEQGYNVKFNMNAILRGDMAARAAFYKALFEVGGLSPNQILALEEMESIGPAGDHRFVPANMVTLENAIKPPEPPPIGHNGGPSIDDAGDAPENEEPKEPA